MKLDKGQNMNMQHVRSPTFLDTNEKWLNSRMWWHDCKMEEEGILE